MHPNIGPSRPARPHGLGSGALRPTLFTVLVLSIATPSQADLFSTDEFRLFADFRARLEADWDSARSDGTERDDRNRLRIRSRIGARYAPNKHVSFGIRLRTGSDDAQQSPHVTALDFDGNRTGDADVNLDKWYIEGKTKRLWGWIGRNGLPFWKQNELYWDDDVTPAGVAGGFNRVVGGQGKLSVTAGYFSIPEGMRDFFGSLAACQLVYARQAEAVGFTLAAGLLGIEADPAASLLEPGSTVDPLLLQGNGSRDYTLWVGSAQVRLRAGGRALILGADFMHNGESYSPTDPDPVTAANADETDGHVVSVGWGETQNKGDWLLAYTYARVEALAVHSSLAQDDWVRWGSPWQTRGSNMKGHEARFAYGLSERVSLVARLYIVKPVNGIEDGKRFRLDLNTEF